MNLEPRSDGAAVHRAALDGYGAGADTYARGRPDYPPELTAWLREVAGVVPGCRVVDLGAGTGKFTRRLLALQADTVAIEPVDAMRAKLQAEVPGAPALAGSASAMPLPDASVDVVVCAQAFHWFATRQALDEIVRVLKPGGRLALVWNLRDASVPWVARMDAIADAHEGEVPRFYQGRWRQAFPHPELGPLAESRFVQQHTGSPDDVIVRRVLSTSFIAALDDAGRAEVEAALRTMIDDEPSLRGRPVVSVPYLSFAYCARKAG